MKRRECFSTFNATGKKQAETMIKENCFEKKKTKLKEKVNQTTSVDKDNTEYDDDFITDALWLRTLSIVITTTSRGQVTFSKQ